MYEKKRGRDCMGNVLIVDDSAFLRMVLADILSGDLLPPQKEVGFLFHRGKLTRI